jgi:hypothetical protein
MRITLGLLEDLPLSLRLCSPATGIQEGDQRTACVQEVGVPAVQLFTDSGAARRALAQRTLQGVP